jgi:hypothetical protein
MSTKHQSSGSRGGSVGSSRGGQGGYDIEVTPSAELVGSLGGGSRGQGGGAQIDITPSEDLIQDVQGGSEGEGEGSGTAGEAYLELRPLIEQAKQDEQIGEQGGDDWAGGQSR